MPQKKIFVTLLLLWCCLPLVYGQQLGLNFNHNPENIDFAYVAEIHPDWIRTTPRILDYADGKLDPERSRGLQNVIKAGTAGYKIVFGFRWDFKKRQLRLPAPGSDREVKYFHMVDIILEKVGQYVDIFSLGNEPNLETMQIDLHYNDAHQVPLVVFTRRLMDHVIGFYENHDWSLPQIYAGSLPALFEHKQQQTPGVAELIKFAQDTKAVTGLSIHLHIEDSLEIGQALQYVRSIMPDKPIIVPEFSLFRLYNKHFQDRIAASPNGMSFLKKYQLPEDLKVYQWLTMVNNGKIPYEQWAEMFRSQSWYVPHYLNTYFRYFKKYHVVLATYPLLQQGFRKQVTPKTPSWFLNPLYLQKSFGKDTSGHYYVNPLVYDDYLRLLQQGRNANGQ